MLPPPPSHHRFVYQKVSAVSEFHHVLCQGYILMICSEQGLLCTFKRPYTCALCHCCSAESLSLKCKVRSTLYCLNLKTHFFRHFCVILAERKVFMVLTIPVWLSKSDFRIMCDCFAGEIQHTI